MEKNKNNISFERDLRENNNDITSLKPEIAVEGNEEHSQGFNAKMPIKTTEIMRDLENEHLECVICNNLIGSSDTIWSCDCCFLLLHFKCALKWISKSNSSEENSFEWKCPTCNFIYLQSGLPECSCYCKKLSNPISEEGKVAHSCGAVCGAKVCQHKRCSALCHPGPHESCTEELEISCFCGKKTIKTTCGKHKLNFSCKQVCNRRKKCMYHCCTRICHGEPCEEGECQECQEKPINEFKKILLKYQEKARIISGDPNLSFIEEFTEYYFKSNLPCKMHHSEQIDVAASQEALKTLGYSGKKLLENLANLVPQCKQQLINRCDCGYKAFRVSCAGLNYSESLTKLLKIRKFKPVEPCNKVCNTLKTCRKHRCLEICCSLKDIRINSYNFGADPEGRHICRKTCDLPLECNKHVCEDYCHLGQCPPCPYRINEGLKQCKCGKTSIKAPFACGTTVECKLPCSAKRTCTHPCPLTCHEGPCPPCENKTSKVCKCTKNLISNQICGNLEKPECEDKCGKLLPCKRHFCKKNCHNHQFNSGFAVCQFSCGKVLEGCKHICQQKCHRISKCDASKCKVKIKTACKCGANVAFKPCGIFNHPDFKLDCILSCQKVTKLNSLKKAVTELFETGKTTVNTANIYSKHKFTEDQLKYATKHYEILIETEIIVEKVLSGKLRTGKTKFLAQSHIEIINEYLLTNYKINTKVEKTEKFRRLVLFPDENTVIPQFNLSLFGLLFKTNLFLSKKTIFHPFQYSIFLKTNQPVVETENIESLLSKFIEPKEFYLVESRIGCWNVYLFKKSIGKRLCKVLFSLTAEFKECKGELLENATINQKNLLIYMKNKEYRQEMYFTKEIKIKKSPKRKTTVDSDGFEEVVVD